MFVVSGFVCLYLHFSYHVEYVLCGLEWRRDVGQGVSFFCVLDRGGSAFLKGITGQSIVWGGHPSLPAMLDSPRRWREQPPWVRPRLVGLPGSYSTTTPTLPGARSPKRRRWGPQRPGLALLALRPQASPGLLFPLRPGTMAWKETGCCLSEPLWGVVGSGGSWPSIQLEGVGSSPFCSALPAWASSPMAFLTAVAKPGRRVTCLSLPHRAVYQSTVSKLLSEWTNTRTGSDFCGRREDWCWKHWTDWWLWLSVGLWA